MTDHQSGDDEPADPPTDRPPEREPEPEWEKKNRDEEDVKRS
jgi:hypothetical protein